MATGAGRTVAVGVGVLLTGALVLAASVLAPGEPGRFAAAFQSVAPLVLLAVLTQLQPFWPALRPLAWLVLIMLLLALLTLVVAATLMAVDPAGAGGSDALPPQARMPLLVALGVGIAGLLGSVGLLMGGTWVRLARRLGGQVTPTDLRHAQGLIGLVAASILAFVPLIALGGEAPALRMVAADPAIFSRDRSSSGQLLDQAYDLAWTIPLALLLVGVPLRRTVREALVRLGVRRLGLRGLAVGVAGAAVLWVVGTALDGGTYWLWGVMGWPRTDPELVNRLMGAALSPVGAFVAAIAAGLGEELMMRGVLQPRFGWLLPNLAFTAAHALQYDLDALIGVFVAGAVLALVRARWSTSEGIVAHALYDLVQLLGGSLE